MRERFLAEQRARLAAWIVPVLAAVAAITLIVAVYWLSGGAGAVRGNASVSLAATAIAAGAGAIAARLARRSSEALFAVAAASSSAVLLGWALTSLFLERESMLPGLVVALSIVCAAVLPLPPLVAAIVSSAGLAAVLLATGFTSLSAALIGVPVAAACILIARARQRQIRRSFIRTERLAAAVRRMRRVQQQLIVVEKLEALRVLVGGIAHELNNSLVIALASTQQAQKLTDDASPAGAALKRGAGGLSRIKTTVERLRRFAMASEGRAEAADVGAMLDFALESAIGRARSGVVVERDYERELGPVQVHVPGLAEALYQVAKNAVEAMPAGGTIRASVKTKGQSVVLSVKDEGKGIPPEKLDHVFDPYFRVTDEGQNKSGLGLSAVYGLVSALGGSVKVESAEGAGTTVAIAVPKKEG